MEGGGPLLLPIKVGERSGPSSRYVPEHRRSPASPSGRVDDDGRGARAREGSSGGSVSSRGGGGLLGVGPVVHGDVQGGDGGGVPADVGDGAVRGAVALPRDVDGDAGGRLGRSALRADGPLVFGPSTGPLLLHRPLQSWREAQSTIARAILTASRYWASSTASAGPGYRVRVA